ncbi:MAG: hypothetical protein JST55_01295 [Bacteroidetes bacterium]|nr:hypothetical protein [Bacteroidota bacterium]
MNTLLDILGNLIILADWSILFRKDNNENEKEHRRKVKSFWKGIAVVIFIFVGGFFIGWLAFKLFG